MEDSLITYRLFIAKIQTILAKVKSIAHFKALVPLLEIEFNGIVLQAMPPKFNTIVLQAMPQKFNNIVQQAVPQTSTICSNAPKIS